MKADDTHQADVVQPDRLTEIRARREALREHPHATVPGMNFHANAHEDVDWLMAEVTRLRGLETARQKQTCETCQFNHNGHGFCSNEHVGSDLFEVECAIVRFCGAWAARGDV